MAAISTSVTSLEFPFGSLLTSTKMVQLRDNVTFNREWIGETHVNSAIQDHDHDGVNSALIATIQDSIVSQPKLKSTTGTVNTTSTIGVNLTLAGGQYGFYPQIKRTAPSVIDAHIAVLGTAAAFTTNIHLISSAGDQVDARQRYIQASPPYKIGDTDWGHFLFALQDTNTNSIMATYEAEDPPWAYNGKTWLDKNNPERISSVPHPFMDYYDKDPALDGLEIILIDLSNVKAKDWINNQNGQGKSIVNDLDKLNLGVRKSVGVELGIDVQGFSDKIKIRNATHSDY